MIVLSQLIFFLLAFGFFVWWERKRPKRNALVWIHPDKGGGIKWDFITPDTKARPYHIKYDPWSFRLKPVYLWYEKKKDNTEDYETIPYEPEPKVINFEPEQATQAGGMAKRKRAITPNALFDTVDWSCARRFEKVKSNVIEAVKLGMGLGMIAIIIFGIVIVLDMLRQAGS